VNLFNSVNSDSDNFTRVKNMLQEQIANEIQLIPNNKLEKKIYEH